MTTPTGVTEQTRIRPAKQAHECEALVKVWTVKFVSTFQEALHQSSYKHVLSYSPSASTLTACTLSSTAEQCPSQ